MDPAWIQVFVLTLAECVAPAGKTVCQEREFDLQFLTRADCEFALEQLVSLKDDSASVIIYRDKSSCAPSRKETSGLTRSPISRLCGRSSLWRIHWDMELNER